MKESAELGIPATAEDVCCPQCGYSLRGLPALHPCPECGHVLDAQRAHADALAWYASWAGVWFWRPPPMVMPHLGDSACRRVARRRLLLGLLLPWVGVTLLMLGLNSIVVVHHWEYWYELPNRPGEKRWLGATTDGDDRLLNSNFYLDLDLGLPWPLGPPARAVRHWREVSREVMVDWPKPDATALAWCIAPTTSLLALVPLSFAIQAIQRWQRRRLPAARRTVLPTLAHFAPWLPIGWMGIAGAALAVGVHGVYGYNVVRSLTHVLEMLPLPASSAVCIGGAYVLTSIARGWYPPLRGPNRLLCFCGALVVWGVLLAGTWLGAAWVIDKLA